MRNSCESCWLQPVNCVALRSTYCLMGSGEMAPVPPARSDLTKATHASASSPLDPSGFSSLMSCSAASVRKYSLSGLDAARH